MAWLWTSKIPSTLFLRSKVDLSEPLLISNTEIECEQEARFLGVIVDESLNWTKHIKTIQSKMSHYVGIMYKIKKYIPLKARLKKYHSFVQPHLNFCSLVWGFSCNRTFFFETEDRYAGSDCWFYKLLIERRRNSWPY